MGLLSNKIAKDLLKLGDHIYSWRKAKIYAHHGIYAGDGKVIHYTRGAGQEVGTGTVIDGVLFSSSRSPLDSPCPICGDQTTVSGVISSCLDCFLAGGDIYLFQYGVTPAFFLAKRGGTCTLAVSDSPEDVLHRANYLLQNGFGVYQIFKNNCEDFAIYCKTGLLVKGINVGRSGQANAAKSAAAAAASFVSSEGVFLIARVCGLAAVTGTMAVTAAALPVAAVHGTVSYFITRLTTDIGMRRDVIKVAVQRLVALPGINVEELETAAS